MLALLENIQSLVWGWPMLIVIFGMGGFLTLRLRAMPQRQLRFSFKFLFTSRDSGDSKNISPFLSLMTALSATIGTGNIAGVATAIVLGGPGAIFWMWLTALVGMATKYAEAVLAVRYRQQDSQGQYHGGPMYYILHGLGHKYRWLAASFAVFGAIAAFGIGNTVQANSLAQAMQDRFDISPAWVALVLLILVYSVVIGGVRRIANVAGKVVPIMGFLYLVVGLVVLVINYESIPHIFTLIFSSAFDFGSAAGGVTGYGIAAAVRYGIARGIFSNEAGLGSASIAHACAQTNSPVRQGLIASLGTFIDTILICGMTAFVILSTDLWQLKDADGQALWTSSALTLQAFSQTLGPWGGDFVAVALAFFAFTTILGWGVYGEKCLRYLFGEKSTLIFRYVWALASPVGALVLIWFSSGNAGVDLVWLISDILNALMAVPNLLALGLLSPVVVSLTRDYLRKSQR